MFGRISCLRAAILNSDRIWLHWGGGIWEGETQNLGKHLEWRDWDETWWEKISTSTSPRYMIDITGTDPLSLGFGWGGGG